MANLSERKKEQLIEMLKTAGPKYKKYLLSQDFYIICEDYSTYNVCFSARKFQHLTGLSVNISDRDFLIHCVNGTISKNNIKTVQHYDYNTLKRKCERLARIDLFLNAGIKTTLFIEELQTNTAVFPVAINNIEMDTCICFSAGRGLIGTSLRTSVNSYNGKSCKKIKCIVSKTKTDDLYSKINYISDIKGLFSELPQVRLLLSDELRNKMDGIV